MIKIDIPMPKNCYECPCNYDYIACGVLGMLYKHSTDEDPAEDRLSCCPLKETDE